MKKEILEKIDKKIVLEVQWVKALIVTFSFSGALFVIGIIVKFC